MNFKIEICVDNIESAQLAYEAGAERIELCNSLPEGGTTPSAGLIHAVRSAIPIRMHVLIRPRGGDFLYSDEEFDIMRRDIELCRKSGVDGIVIGILNKDGSIDTSRTKTLVELARPLSVTFHRAFDLCNDPVAGLTDVISTGANRLLTSGLKNKASEGAELIKELITRTNNRLIVMPGSGINLSNIEEIKRITGASEFHLTGRKTITSRMEFRREGIRLGGTGDSSEYSRKIVDSDMIRSIISKLKMD